MSDENGWFKPTTKNASAANKSLIKLAHGEGGRLMQQFVRKHILERFDNDALRSLDDAARLPQFNSPMSMSTDSYVVTPLFFPGGDIGKLAVYGTSNDLGVNGARPRYMTMSLIIEDGFPLPTLEEVLDSMRTAADEIDVAIVAGDTKVVPRGAVDGLFVNTTGIGELNGPIPPGPRSLREGDAILISGPVARHGIAILVAREELALEPPPKSDCGSLIPAVETLQDAVGDQIRAMRDATRGGVAAVLHEWAAASACGMRLEEKNILVDPDVRGACELLGLDPLFVANEGMMVVAVAAEAVTDALSALRSVSISRRAAVIGEVTAKGPSPVTVTRSFDRPIPLDLPSGAPLPRIC